VRRRSLDRHASGDFAHGLGHETTLDYVVAMCERVLRETTLVPHVNAGTMSEGELTRVRAVSGSVGLMLENVSRRLVQLGMAHHACPDKMPVQRLRTLKQEVIVQNFRAKHGTPMADHPEPDMNDLRAGRARGLFGDGIERLSPHGLQTPGAPGERLQ